ncbi:unnamed protein product, partial [Rotaria sordida]
TIDNSSSSTTIIDQTLSLNTNETSQLTLLSQISDKTKACVLSLIKELGKHYIKPM